MDQPTALACRLLAEALRYPEPERRDLLQQEAQKLSDSSEKKALLQFVSAIQAISLEEWEELHTRTLDLNPPAAPYVGFQTWGESYQRGAFLSQMSHELIAFNIDTDGELPDHLIPILRYLAAAPDPLPELLALLGPATQRMSAGLRQLDPCNPYLFLFEGVLALSKTVLKEAV